MKNNLSPEQKKLLHKIRTDAQEILKTCQAAEEGHITAEQFESRISKLRVGPPQKGA